MQMPGLAQVAVRHLGSHVELMGQAAGEYQASFLRRALLWDTPWRVACCISSAQLQEWRRTA